MEPVLPNFIVGIGGSAGAFSAYKVLLETLPRDDLMRISDAVWAARQAARAAAAAAASGAASGSAAG